MPAQTNDNDVNRRWLGEVQPVGVVVTPATLATHALVPAHQTRVDSQAVRCHLREPDEPGPALHEPWTFFADILDWRAEDVAGSPGGAPITDSLRISLASSETVLEPHLAVRATEGDSWQMLVRIEAAGIDPDARGALTGWEATPHQRFERLLRDTGVATGLLITDQSLRLVHSPAGGETSGWFDMPLRPLGTVPGRDMLGGLKLLLDRFRLFGDAPERRLPALLAASRRAQADVSAMLARQVLGALHELLRGLHAAVPAAIERLTATQPGIVYEGLLTVLLRLVFLLYAEDRGLIPSRAEPEFRAFYDQGYGVRTLHARLLEDAALHPDTMGERVGAWNQLLVLFRLVHAGDGSGWMRGRGGKLFDPTAFPFLLGQERADDPIRIPAVSDSCVMHVLDELLVLRGERLSYRALDVEQIGSVYETVMGFAAQQAAGPSLAIAAGKNKQTPVYVDLAALASVAGGKRVAWLKDHTERGDFPKRVVDALATATDADELAAALRPVVDERGSPGGVVLAAGAPLLQPTDERRRTGSHYTPRDLTAPIVRHALEPAFARIGLGARPEAVLALKVCDPAMGSGAFLVEACRQLGERLEEAWRLHSDTRPAIPPDEDEALHARRLVAQRCLYGVDRNPLAADLAKLSLWLATLARDHEFTFLDHALKVGDSLVGLTAKQIGGFRWEDGHADVAPMDGFVRERIRQAVEARQAIRDAPDDVTREIQEQRFRHGERLAAQARMLGDATLAAFFGADKPRPREIARKALGAFASQEPEQAWPAVAALAMTLTQGPAGLRPFHWELEFPEVFSGDAPGFEAIVGNPPFAGKNTLINGHRAYYLDWLQTLHAGAHGNADLVTHFFRRAFALLREGGCFGLIATNTVGQGDTRESGLRRLLNEGGEILRATRRVQWPGEAAVVVSVVHLRRGHLHDQLPPVLDGRTVGRISAYLMEGFLDDSPRPLAENERLGFEGYKIYGQGFLFSDRDPDCHPMAAMESLIKKDIENSKIIFPYIGGEELANDPIHAHHRYAIDFNDIPLDREQATKAWEQMSDLERVIARRAAIVPHDYPGPVASDWPELLDAVRRAVLPYRRTQKRQALRDRWWQFGEKRPGLRQALDGLDEVIVVTRISPHLAFCFGKSNRRYSHMTHVFVKNSYAFFGVLQSRVHEVWARYFCSTLEDRLNYSLTDSFQTFARPSDGMVEAVEVIGANYNAHRAAILLARNIGLTATYNCFHNSDECTPDILHLRALHHDMDMAVLRAYGWHDLAARAAPEHLIAGTEFDHRFQDRLFWPASFRDEVLARLLALNAVRAATERNTGLDLDLGELEDA